MPLGPDVLGYTDLRLYDVSAEQLLALAVARHQALQPNWIPRAGNVEVTLLEAMSLPVAEAVHALNRIPGVVVEGVFAAYGVVRSAGAQATGTATVTLGDTLGHVIPAGTRLAVTLAGTDYQLVVAADTAVAAGSSSAVVPVRASAIGTALNGLAVGTRARIVDQVPYLDSVVLASALGGGANPETDAELASRGRARTGRLNDALVLPEHFRLAALDVTGIARARAYPRFDPAAPGATTLGHVTVAVVGPAGALLPQATKDALTASLTARAVAGTAVHVIDPTVTAVDVSLTVQALPGAAAGAVVVAVTAALAAYLSPDSWAWGGTVYINQLIAVADLAAGVDRVVSITTPSADRALSGTAPLAKLGNVTVTVQAAS